MLTPVQVGQVNSSIPYVCPECRSTLRHAVVNIRGEQLTCVKCTGSYAVSHGIPILISREAYHRFPIREVQAIYDRAYDHPGIMGTQLDREYSRITKTTLLDFCRDAPNPRLLDVGSGDGDLWKFAATSDGSHSVDISEVGVRRALDRFPSLRGAVAVAEWLPYPDGYFGSIVAADTLEHTFDLTQSLREIRRVLVADSTFACSVPAPNSLQKWGYSRFVRSVPSIGLFIRLVRVVLLRAYLFGRPNFQPLDRDLSLDSWRRTMEEAGFRVVAVQEWPSTPLKPIVYLISMRPRS